MTAEFGGFLENEMEDKEKLDWLLFAALLLNRRAPMAPHHVAAIRERLGYATDAQLLEAVQKGMPPNAKNQGDYGSFIAGGSPGLPG